MSLKTEVCGRAKASPGYWCTRLLGHEGPCAAISLRESNAAKWDLRFLELAKHISNWSKDPSTKVGAVLVNDLKQVVGMGYNGFPRGVEDTDERLNDRETKYKLVVHAEVNAIIQAGKEARDSVLYVYPAFAMPPICNECCKVAIQAGVQGIVGYSPDETDPRSQRWKASIDISRAMWVEANLWMEEVKELV